MVQESMLPSLTYNSLPVQHLDMSHSQCNELKQHLVRTGKNSTPSEGVIIRRSGGRQLEVLLTLIHPEVPEGEIDAHALLDSGCTGSCVDAHFVSRYRLPTK